MVFQCFLDDSKDQLRDKVFVSAGFFGRREDWRRLRLSWGKCLVANGIKYFKTSEYKMLERQFGKFKTAAYPPPTGREKAAAIRDALLEIPRRFRGIKGVGIFPFRIMRKSALGQKPMIFSQQTRIAAHWKAFSI